MNTQSSEISSPNGRSSSRQYSLKNIFIIGGIIFTLAFCLTSAISTINIIKAENTVESHSRLENQIFFPLTRAIEEIYNSLADLQSQFTRRQGKSTVQQFKWNMESAMANLGQAEEAIEKLLTRNTDIVTAVSETRRAAVSFQKSGIRALEQTARLYNSLARCDQKIDEITEWTRRFFMVVTENGIAAQGNYAPNSDVAGNGIWQNAKYHQDALDALAEARITYLKLCAVFYRKVIFFHEIDNLPDMERNWNRLFSELEKFADSYPRIAGRVLFLEEDLKTLRSNMKDVFSSAIAAAASIERANSLADELGINLELCRQAIAAVNIEIQQETRKLRLTMAISLASAVLFYILAAFFTARWLRRNVLDPLDTFNAAIERIAGGDGHIKIKTPALKEISGIAERFNLMTQRLREREEGLQRARQKWETVFRTIGGPAMVLSKDFTILEYNETLHDLLASKCTDGKMPRIKGRKCYEVLCGSNRPQDKCPVEYMLSGREGQVCSLEKEIGGKPHLVTLSPNTDGKDRVESIVMVGADLSLQKKLEEQLRRAQKMEALGTLAGGVAHDLNNILAGIVTYPDIMLMQLPEDSPFRKALLTIKKSGLKATAVVQDLLTLARRGVENRKVLNINEIIRDYLESPELKKTLEANRGVHVESRLAPDLMNIEGSPVHIAKTVMNLVTNAAEAMPNGGTITVSTRNVYVDKPIPGYDKVTEGDYVLLTVVDNGTGISSQDLPHIFEPFYTRKVMGRSGSGLGMAVVWGSVKDHFGYIDIESASGKGTTVRIYLPVTRQAGPHKSSMPALEELRGSESILVVDDVKEQREVARYLLETLGYKVDTAESGEEAVEMCRNSRYDLVILDMIMDPGIDGLETYRRILEINPDQKAVIASGFSETERVREAQQLGAGAYIKKPYTMENLAMAVRHELDK